MYWYRCCSAMLPACSVLWLYTLLSCTVLYGDLGLEQSLILISSFNAMLYYMLPIWAKHGFRANIDPNNNIAILTRVALFSFFPQKYFCLWAQYFIEWDLKGLFESWLLSLPNALLWHLLHAASHGYTANIDLLYKNNNEIILNSNNKL